MRLFVMPLVGVFCVLLSGCSDKNEHILVSISRPLLFGGNSGYHYVECEIIEKKGNMAKIKLSGWLSGGSEWVDLNEIKWIRKP